MEWGVLEKKNISSDQEMTQPKLNPSFKTKMEITERTSDIFNEWLPIKMAREKFQRKRYFVHEKDSKL